MEKIDVKKWWEERQKDYIQDQIDELDLHQQRIVEKINEIVEKINKLKAKKIMGNINEFKKKEEQC